MLTQLPDDVVAVGYKEVRPFHHAQVFQSASAGFTGTEREFVEAGHAYEYQQLDAHARTVQTEPENKPAKKLVVSDLDESRQAFVLAMVQGNLVPETVAKSHPWFGKTRKGFDCLSGAGYRQLCELEAKGFKASADEARKVVKAHWSSWAKSAVEGLLTPELTS